MAIRDIEYMEADTRGLWRNSCEESKHTVPSIIYELMNNVKHTDDSETRIKYTYNVDDTFILSVSDTGMGFTDIEDLDNAVKLCTSNRVGNNNFGHGMKSPLQLTTMKNACIQLIYSKRLDKLIGFKCKYLDQPEKLYDEDLIDIFKEYILGNTHIEYETLIIAFWGGGIHKMELVEVIKSYGLEQQKLELFDYNSNIPIQSVIGEHYNNKIYYNDEVVKLIQLFDSSSKIIIDIRTYKHLEDDKDEKDAVVLFSKNIPELKLGKKIGSQGRGGRGGKKFKLNSKDWNTDNKKYKKQIHNSWKIEIVDIGGENLWTGCHQPIYDKYKSEDSESICASDRKKIFIEIDGIIISEQNINTTNGQPNLRVKLCEIKDDSILLRKHPNKSLTDIISPYDKEIENIVQWVINNYINKKDVTSQTRKGFSPKTIQTALQVQDRCPITGTKNEIVCGKAKTYQVDHKNDDPSDNSQENCNPISTMAHAIKNADKDIYHKLIENPEGCRELKLRQIKQMIESDSWNPIEVQELSALLTQKMLIE
jgi:hypothetical protein